MIRHRPFGLGHPYRLEPDQRVPAQPVAGEPIELRATTDAAVETLLAELSIDGRREEATLKRIGADVSGSGGSDADAAQSGGALGSLATGPATDGLHGGDGHLAAAAAKVGGAGRRSWRLVLGPMAAGTQISYRFRAGKSRSRRFGMTVAGWYPAGGELRLRLADPASPEASRDRLVPASVAWLRADGGPLRVRFALRLEAGAHVVGFGERFDRLDQGGRRLDATVFEQYRGQGNRTYIPVPFAIVIPPDGGPSWGLHVRSGARTWFDVGASEPDRLWIEVQLDPDAARPGVEVALYAGPPAHVLSSFLAEIGRPTVPPDWVFRPWMSGNEWNSQARVEAEVERSLAEGIPVGALVIEAWSDETTFVAFRGAGYEVHPDGSPHRLADFTFPPDGAWPDPRGLVEWLHERDINLVLWQVPLLPARSGPADQAHRDRETMIARGYGVREADGRPYRNRGWWFPRALMPDWTNPEAAAWWLAKRRYLVEDLGIDGFKTDGGEHAWGDELSYADGSRGVDTNNRYPVMYAAAYHELMKAAGREPVTFSRAGFTGAGSYPLHWAGDERSTWPAFRASVTAGLTAGASGIFIWGWDLAGFSGEIPDAELYLRSAAMACFCPVMQYHSEFNHHRKPSRDRTPWNIAERTGDARVLSTYRAFAQLRERLVPYLSAQARLAAERGVPLMRALFFEWPDDPEIWRHPYQYLLGDELLVAPVVEPGAGAWDVYLPAGRWIDAWRRTRVLGPTVVRVPAPLDEIPVFVRAASFDLMRGLFERGGPEVDRGA
jgi:alpha-glucosidase (family GH31 glycosyl hydrolase)